MAARLFGMLTLRPPMQRHKQGRTISLAPPSPPRPLFPPSTTTATPTSEPLATNKNCSEHPSQSFLANLPRIYTPISQRPPPLNPLHFFLGPGVACLYPFSDNLAVSFPLISNLLKPQLWPLRYRSQLVTGKRSRSMVESPFLYIFCVFHRFS